MMNLRGKDPQASFEPDETELSYTESDELEAGEPERDESEPPSEELSEEEEAAPPWEWDPLSIFGSGSLVKAARDPDTMRRLLSESHPVTTNAVFATIMCNRLDTFQTLLGTGFNPNAGLISPKSEEALVDSAWAEADDYDVYDKRFSEGFALYHAASGDTRSESARERTVAILNTLLDYRPDLYATFRQPRLRRRIASFPGVKTGLEGANRDRLASTEQLSYGLRSVVHAILEDGGMFHPILAHPDLDLERRDPQGRTLFLSMCRSSIGADAAVDSVLDDAGRWRGRDSCRVSPFATSDARPSLFDTFHKRGANLLVKDDHGKNALHHLLESVDPITYSYRPPGIRRALLFMLEHHASLVNQPDRHGDYPLHAALQRLRRRSLRFAFDDENKALDTVIDDLLAAGADPCSRDSRGNTALHYLADGGLAERIDGALVRRLFRTLLDRGVDVNARNRAGRTALGMLLDDDGRRARLRLRHYQLPIEQGGMPFPSADEVDKDVFGWFEEAGARWTGVDTGGRTLLHIVARHVENERGPAWARILLGKGVDPAARDGEGKTAAKIASACGTHGVLEALRAETRTVDG